MKTLKDLFEKYATIRTYVVNCDNEGCETFIEDKIEMSQILQEAEQLIRKEVLEDLLKYVQEDIDFGAKHQQIVSTTAQSYLLTQLKQK